MSEQLILLTHNSEFPIMTFKRVAERVFALQRGQTLKADVLDVPVDELPGRIEALRLRHFNQAHQGILLGAQQHCEGCGEYTFYVYDLHRDVLRDEDFIR